MERERERMMIILAPRSIDNFTTDTKFCSALKSKLFEDELQLVCFDVVGSWTWHHDCLIKGRNFDQKNNRSAENRQDLWPVVLTEFIDFQNAHKFNCCAVTTTCVVTHVVQHGRVKYVSRIILYIIWLRKKSIPSQMKNIPLNDIPLCPFT